MNFPLCNNQRPPFLLGSPFYHTGAGVHPRLTSFILLFRDSTCGGGQCLWRFTRSGYTPRLMLFNAGRVTLRPPALTRGTCPRSNPILYYAYCMML